MNAVVCIMQGSPLTHSQQSLNSDRSEQTGANKLMNTETYSPDLNAIEGFEWI